MEADKILLGVSTCLLGEKVRWDGDHRRDLFLTDILSKYAEFFPVCPEVEAGLGIPREPLRLEGNPARPRLIATHSRTDRTKHLENWAHRRVAELAAAGLCGFVFKSGSPSSGMEHVEVYDENGIPSGRGVGIFARIFMDRFPLVPVEDEKRLNDPAVRESFIERMLVLKRWQEEVPDDPNQKALLDFHTRHELLILSHDPETYLDLSRLVRSAGTPAKDKADAYLARLMPALEKNATTSTHRDVLERAAPTPAPKSPLRPRCSAGDSDVRMYPSDDRC